MALTRKQYAVIHIAKKQLGLSDEAYRDTLRTMAGVERSRDLDQAGFELVMHGMVSLGVRSKFTKTFYGFRHGRATPRQVSLIRQLWREFTGGEGSAGALDKWLERTFKVSALRFLTADQARKAIQGLFAMKRRQAATARDDRESA